MRARRRNKRLIFCCFPRGVFPRRNPLLPIFIIKAVFYPSAVSLVLGLLVAFGVGFVRCGGFVSLFAFGVGSIRSSVAVFSRVLDYGYWLWALRGGGADKNDT